MDGRKDRRIVFVRDDVAHERADLERHLVRLRAHADGAFDMERGLAAALRLDLRVLDLHVAVTAGTDDERVARDLDLELLQHGFWTVFRAAGLEHDREAEPQALLGARNDSRGFALGDASELDAPSISLRDDDGAAGEVLREIDLAVRRIGRRSFTLQDE